MSKYKHNITETKQDRIMINIANEIAEANRLTRLKLGDVFLTRELEDQA